LGEEPRRVLVATIGFTADFVLRRISDEGRTAYSRVVAVALDSGDRVARQRVEATFNMLASLLRNLQIESELRFIKPEKAVAQGKDVLNHALKHAGSNGTVEVYLTGGPRIAVAALTLAAILYEADLGAPGRIMIVSYGEAFESRLHVDAATVVKLVLISGDAQARAILEELRRSGTLTPQDLLKRTGMPRSTLYKKLNDLKNMGLIVYDETARGYKLAPQVEALL